MGIAAGCIGMSLDDFFRCTPSEFYAISSSWREYRTTSEQAAWERSRFVTATLLQPHTRRPLKPRDICTFSWEKNTREETPAEDVAQAEKSTRERFEEIKERWGK